MTLIILGKDGVDLRQENVESVHVIFTDGNVEIFEHEYTDAVILNHSEIKYIKVNFEEEQNKEILTYIE